MDAIIDGDDDGGFPSWQVQPSSRIQSELTIDGQSVSSILSKVNIQIEMLHKKSKSNSSHINTSVDKLNKCFEKLDVLEGAISSLGDELKTMLQRTPSPRITPQPVLSEIPISNDDLQNEVVNFVDNEKFLEINERLIKVESTLEQLTGKILENESKYNEEIRAINTKTSIKFEKMEKIIIDLSNKVESLLNEKEQTTNSLKDHDMKIQDITSQLRLNNEKSYQSIKDITSKLEANDSFYESINSNLNENSKSLTQLSLKVHYLDEMRACHEVKIKSLEGDVFSALETVSDNKRSINNVIEPQVEDIYSKIQNIWNVKAEKSEMNMKADLALVNQKASIEDLRYSNEFSNELKASIHNQANLTSDSLKALERNFDKKLETVLSALLTYMKKEMKNDRDSKDGTDIGRIRCLVCDQFVNQKPTIEREGDTGGKLNPTLKHLVVHSDPNNATNSRPQSAFATSASSTYPAEELKASPTRKRGTSPPRESGTKLSSNDDIFTETELMKTYFGGSQLDPENLLPSLGADGADSSKKNTNLARLRAIPIEEQDIKFPASTLFNSSSAKSFSKNASRDYVDINASNYMNSNIPNTATANSQSVIPAATTNSEKAGRPGSAPAKRAVQGRLQHIGRPVANFDQNHLKI